MVKGINDAFIAANAVTKRAETVVAAAAKVPKAMRVLPTTNNTGPMAASSKPKPTTRVLTGPGSDPTALAIAPNPLATVLTSGAMIAPKSMSEVLI